MIIQPPKVYRWAYAYQENELSMINLFEELFVELSVYLKKTHRVFSPIGAKFLKTLLVSFYSPVVKL